MYRLQLLAAPVFSALEPSAGHWKPELLKEAWLQSHWTLLLLLPERQCLTLFLALLARSAADATDPVTAPTPSDCASPLGPKGEMLVGAAILQAVRPSRRVGCCVQAGRFKHKLCWGKPGKRVVGIVRHWDVCNRTLPLSLQLCRLQYGLGGNAAVETGQTLN